MDPENPYKAPMVVLPVHDPQAICEREFGPERERLAAGALASFVAGGIELPFTPWQRSFDVIRKVGSCCVCAGGAGLVGLLTCCFLPMPPQYLECLMDPAIRVISRAFNLGHRHGEGADVRVRRARAGQGRGPREDAGVPGGFGGLGWGLVLHGPHHAACIPCLQVLSAGGDFSSMQPVHLSEDHTSVLLDAGSRLGLVVPGRKDDVLQRIQDVAADRDGDELPLRGFAYRALKNRPMTEAERREKALRERLTVSAAACTHATDLLFQWQASLDKPRQHPRPAGARQGEPLEKAGARRAGSTAGAAARPRCGLHRQAAGPRPGGQAAAAYPRRGSRSRGGRHPSAALLQQGGHPQPCEQPRALPVRTCHGAHGDGTPETVHCYLASPNQPPTNLLQKLISPKSKYCPVPGEVELLQELLPDAAAYFIAKLAGRAVDLKPLRLIRAVAADRGTDRQPLRQFGDWKAADLSKAHARERSLCLRLLVCLREGVRPAGGRGRLPTPDRQTRRLMLAQRALHC